MIVVVKVRGLFQLFRHHLELQECPLSSGWRCMYVATKQKEAPIGPSGSLARIGGKTSGGTLGQSILVCLSILMHVCSSC